MSAITILIIAGMCCAVLLTSGRAVGSEQKVLQTLDSAGTKSIVVRASGDAGLDSSVMGRISRIRGIEWVGGFGPATDVHNAAVVEGARVPIRDFFGMSPWLSDHDKWTFDPGESAGGSRSALKLLGMSDKRGGVVASDGAGYPIGGPLEIPSYLDFLEPVVLIPRQSAPTSTPSPISVLVIIARAPELVSPVAAALPSLLGVTDMSKVTISTSASLATLRFLVRGQLSTFSQGLMGSIFGVTAVLVAVVLYGLVTLRRRDFGRRRALGASQRLIVGLLLLQVAALSGLGAIGGCLLSILGLWVGGDPLPGGAFVLAVAFQALLTAVAAALIPALVASRRDPLRELRVA